MSSTAPQLPLDLGKSVQHCSDPTKAVGTIIGEMFDPPLGTLVRWQDGASTFEARDDIEDLVDPIGIPAAISIAEQIRRRIERHILPVTAPATTTSVRLSQWQPCDGCDELIAPGRVAYALEYRVPSRVVRLHGACHRLWAAECRRSEERHVSASAPGARGDQVRCAICQRPIEARQNVRFRIDDHVEHVSCPTSQRKPLARMPAEQSAELVCSACGKTIEPAQRIVTYGATLLHGDCFVEGRRPIAGGQALPTGALVADEHTGQRLGLTRVGHRDFLAVCAEILGS
jgi:hypothetical protein